MRWICWIVLIGIAVLKCRISFKYFCFIGRWLAKEEAYFPQIHLPWGGSWSASGHVHVNSLLHKLYSHCTSFHLVCYRDQLLEMMSSRVRRRFRRGLKRKHMALLKKLRAAKKEATELEKPAVVKTHLRNMVIVPEMVGSVVGVYNGKVFNSVEVKVCRHCILAELLLTWNFYSLKWLDTTWENSAFATNLLNMVDLVLVPPTVPGSSHWSRCISIITKWLRSINIFAWPEFYVFNLVQFQCRVS